MPIRDNINSNCLLQTVSNAFRMSRKVTSVWYFLSRVLTMEWSSMRNLWRQDQLLKNPNWCKDIWGCIKSIIFWKMRLSRTVEVELTCSNKMGLWLATSVLSPLLNTRTIRWILQSSGTEPWLMHSLSRMESGAASVVAHSLSSLDLMLSKPLALSASREARTV